MTAAALNRLCAINGRKPEGWHLQLAEEISYLAVYHIFMSATEQKTALYFSDRELAEKAKPFMSAVCRVFERFMDIATPSLPRDYDKPPARPLVTEEEKKRMRAAAKARWDKAREAAAGAIEQQSARLREKARLSSTTLSTHQTEELHHG